MPEDDINYVKEVLQSELNLAFIGVMLFLTLIGNWACLPFLLAGEIACLFIAQNTRVQRIIRSRKNKDQKLEIQEAETTIIRALPQNYQFDFQSLRSLCEEIERRSAELDGSGSNIMLSGLTEKLSSFRYEYARMLRAHHLLSTRNYRNIQNALTNEISKAEKAIEREESPQVKQALTQNLNILKQRSARIRRLDELVRLLEARLQVIKNSLSLIQDEVYSMTDVAGISGLVDNLLLNLSVSDEFRAAYEDVLSVGSNMSTLSTIEGMTLEPEMSQEAPPAQQADPRIPPREQIRRIK
ncbi:MAG: hypothetical protein K1Y36_04755 [Blastocatellia bacterium]|nr:hypothetical protein [Blastocatellia bacterium]